MIQIGGPFSRNCRHLSIALEASWILSVLYLILIRWRASKTDVMFVFFHLDPYERTIYSIRLLRRLLRLKTILKSSSLEPMFLTLMPSLLINVLLLLLLTRSRHVGHVKNMEHVTFLQIRNISRSTVFVLVLGQLQWYVIIISCFYQNPTIIIIQAAGKCDASDPPPRDLFQTWTTVSTTTLGKPQGCTGPNPVSAPSSSPSTHDPSTLLLASVASMVSQNMQPRNSHKCHHYSPTPPSSPVCPSSPPQPDELENFLDAFGKRHRIKDDALETAKTALQNAHFMPDILTEDTVTIDRLKELTSLGEGEVHALKKFARKWSSSSSKLSSKWVKYLRYD